jgi:hypothetical protein
MPRETSWGPKLPGPVGSSGIQWDPVGKAPEVHIIQAMAFFVAKFPSFWDWKKGYQTVVNKL